MNASATKNVYTEIGFGNHFSVVIDQSGIIRYKGNGVNVSLITSWLDNLLTTSIDENETKFPAEINLEQNYPNPFNPITKISFVINQSQKVNLEVFDVTGKLIRKLIDNTMNAGRHELYWDGKDNFGNNVNSGIYFYQLHTGSNSITRKMTLLR